MPVLKLSYYYVKSDGFK